MTRIKTTIVAFAMGATVLAVLPSEANADGPLRRWWRGLRTPKTSCSTCPPATVTAGYTPNAYDLKPGQCMKTCQQTCTRTVVNYVPYTAYRTNWKKVPVTQYKPVTTSDPCTGCTVTCMKPCTTYTYQCQRVPYTTYRPVYRQETYKVPVTTITNDCSTGTCGPCNTCVPCNTCDTCDTGCATCATGVASPAPQNFAPQTPTPAPISNTYYEQAPSSTSAVPANTSPSLLDGVSSPQALQRPLLDRFGNQTRSNYQTSSPKPVEQPWSSAPATINIDDKTAQSPVRKRWSYSPVRMASYSKPSNVRSLAPLPSAKPATVWANPQQANRELNGWVEVN
jgi:hypothetical protein